MPLDPDAQRYADNLLIKHREEINREFNEKIISTRRDFAKRQMLRSGVFLTALAGIEAERIGRTATAFLESLDKATSSPVW